MGSVIAHPRRVSNRHCAAPVTRRVVHSDWQGQMVAKQLRDAIVRRHFTNRRTPLSSPPRKSLLDLLTLAERKPARTVAVLLTVRRLHRCHDNVDTNLANAFSESSGRFVITLSRHLRTCGLQTIRSSALSFEAAKQTVNQCGIGKRD